MPIDRDQLPAAADMSRALGGGARPGDDAPEPAPERPEPKTPDADDEDKLDEELDESFPASDPPASTQP